MKENVDYEKHLSQSLIKKIENLIQYAKEHRALETKEYILENFNEYKGNNIQREDIYQAYYDSYTINIYLKGMQGIYISIEEGDWDKIGKKVSHHGIDISIVNPIRDSARFYLFKESRRIKESNFDLDLLEIKKEDVLEYLKSYNSLIYVYKDLSNDLKEDHDIIKAFSSKLVEEAKFKADDEKEYSDISPNGGLDVYVHKWQDHYLDMLEKFNDGLNDNFLHYAEKKFTLIDGNKRYIQEEILRNEKIIYFVDHKDEYIAKQQNDLKSLDDEEYLNTEVKERDDITNLINNKDKELSKNIEALNELKKQNGFIDRLKNKNKIKELQNEIEDLKYEKQSLLEKLQAKQYDIQRIEESIEESKKPFKDLKYNFDYLLKDTFVEVFDYYDNFSIALDRMETNYNDVKKRLGYLKYLRSEGMDLYINNNDLMQSSDLEIKDRDIISGYELDENLEDEFMLS